MIWGTAKTFGPISGAKLDVPSSKILSVIIFINYIFVLVRKFRCLSPILYLFLYHLFRESHFKAQKLVTTNIKQNKT